MSLDVVILAAGKGTRMRSGLAKVLHTLAGRSLIQHVVHAASELKPRHIAVVVGHQADDVKDHLGDGPTWVEQTEQLGTGHAVRLAMEPLPGDGVVRSGLLRTHPPRGGARPVRLRNQPRPGHRLQSDFLVERHPVVALDRRAR